MSGSQNTSATGGYLQEIVSPLYDDALTNILQGFVSGLTGINPTLVRPRWQPQPPTQPPVTIDWCALGIISFNSADYPFIAHCSDGNGYDTLNRLERINLLVSFYGPNSTNNAAILRDGCYVDQNFGTLEYTNFIKFRSADDIINVSEVINSQYVYRADIELNFRRMVQRTYPVENLLGAVVVIDTSNGDSVTIISPEESA